MCYMTLMVPPYLIWNRYHMVPHMWSVFMSYMTHMVPHTLYGIAILWSPLTLYGTGIVWPPHVKCLHILYDSYGPPVPYMEQVSYGPPTRTYGPPTCEVFSCLI